MGFLQQREACSSCPPAAAVQMHVFSTHSGGQASSRDRPPPGVLSPSVASAQGSTGWILRCCFGLHASPPPAPPLLLPFTPRCQGGGGRRVEKEQPGRPGRRRRPWSQRLGWRPTAQVAPLHPGAVPAPRWAPGHWGSFGEQWGQSRVKLPGDPRKAGSRPRPAEAPPPPRGWGPGCHAAPHPTERRALLAEGGRGPQAFPAAKAAPPGGQ